MKIPLTTRALLPHVHNHEEILLIIRPHWFDMVPSFFLSLLSGGILIGLLLILRTSLALPVHFLVLGMVSIFLLIVGIVAFITVRWFCHGYLLTRTRIEEYYCLPLLMHATNGILLNQVRCTEIDVNKNGILHHLFNVGDITLTFDRPTREELFTLRRISEPENMGDTLSEILNNSELTHTTSPIWNKNPLKRRRVIYPEEGPRMLPSSVD